MRTFFASACCLLFAASFVSAKVSPHVEAKGMIGGKSLTITYGAPSIRGRKMFGDGGRISQDPNYPVWRAGADSSTTFHTDSDLVIGNLNVPKGDYSFYVLVADPNAWQLIINKQTGQWGLSYDQGQDLGRIKMKMSKPAAPVEQLKYVISSNGAKTGTIEMDWDDHVASVPVTVK